MKHEISAIGFGGERFKSIRNGREVAELSPPTRGSATFHDLWRALQAQPPLDDDFASDLEAIRAGQPPLPDDPW